MKEPGPGKAQRLTGIAIGPFIMLRALGGILLSVDRLPGIHRRAGDAVRENVPRLLRLGDMIQADIRYGMDVGGAFCHLLSGGAAIGVAPSGFMIFLRIRARQKLQQRSIITREDSTWKKRPGSILSISS